MLKPLSLTIPLQQHETASSFASRLAQRNGRPTLGAFCGDMGIDPSKLSYGCPDTLEKLSALGSADSTALKLSTPRHIERNRYQIGCEEIGARHVYKTFIRFCPFCLSEDFNGLGRTALYCRLSWNIGFITCCLKHRITLTVRSQRLRGIPAQDFAARMRTQTEPFTPENPELVPDPDLNLERYFWNRVLSGHTGVWLDELPLDVCDSFCHYFGALKAFGPDVDRKTMTISEWRKAGSFGFSRLKSGPAAFGESLARHKTKTNGSADRRRKDYLIFADWIHEVKHLEKFLPIWKLFEAYLIEHYPVGTAVTNYTNSSYQDDFVSLEQLENDEGVFPTFIHHWMVQNGRAVSSERSNRPLQIKPLTKKDASKIVSEFRTLIPIIEVTEIFNFSIDLVDDLCQSGLLNPVSYRMGKKRFFDRNAIYKFKEQMESAVVYVDVSSDNMMSIRDLAKKFSCKATILFEGVLTGVFQNKEMANGSTNLLDIELDLAEAERFSIGDPTINIHKTELINRLQVNATCVDALVATDYPNLQKNGLNRSIKSGRAIVDLNSVTAFETEYVSLSKLSSETGLHYSKLSTLLRKAGISYLSFKNKSVSRIYRRSDLKSLNTRLLSQT